MRSRVRRRRSPGASSAVVTGSTVTFSIMKPGPAWPFTSLNSLTAYAIVGP